MQVAGLSEVTTSSTEEVDFLLYFLLSLIWSMWHSSSFDEHYLPLSTKFVHVFCQLSETLSGYEASDKREPGKNTGTDQGQKHFNLQNYPEIVKSYTIAKLLLSAKNSK